MGTEQERVEVFWYKLDFWRGVVLEGVQGTIRDDSLLRGEDELRFLCRHGLGQAGSG